MGRKTTTRLMTAGAALALVLAGCSAGGSGESGATTLQVTRTSTLDPGDINDVVGPIEFGEAYGVEQTIDDFETFNSHATAMQIVLSGKAQVLVGSFIASLQAVDEGLPIKVFCPKTVGFDMRIIGTGDVTSLEYLGEHLDVPAAIEGTGGSTNIQTDLVLRATGQDYSVGDLTNPIILEDSPLRVGALISGDALVSTVNNYQVPEIIEALGEENVHILGNTLEDINPGTVLGAFAANTSWLEEHAEEAAAFCASVMEGSKALSEDLAFYQEMNDKYLTPKVEAEILQTNWEAINQNELFPYSGDEVISRSGVADIVGVAQETGLISEEIAFEDVIAVDVLERAVELLAAGGTD